MKKGEPLSVSVTTYTNFPLNTNSGSGAIVVPAPGRQPDVFPDVRRRNNLYHASVHAAETKRLILAERQHVLHRATWLALSVLAEICTHLLLALDHLSAGEK